MFIKNTERNVTPLFSTTLRLASVGLFLSIGLALLAQSAFAQSSISAGGPMITGVSVYTGPRQTGAVGVFGVGTYAANNGSMTQIANDSAVSIFVPPGFRVRICSAEGGNSDGAGDCEEPQEGGSELKWPRTASWIKVWSEAKNQIYGNVTDYEGKPVENASVKIIGTDNVTKTDFGGRFVLPRSEKNEQLVVSGTGYSDQEVDIKNNTSVTVKLRKYSKPEVMEFDDLNFDEEVGNSDKLVVVVFTTEWTRGKLSAPWIGDLQRKFYRTGKVKVGVCDPDSSPKAVKQENIRYVPTLILFKNGKPVGRLVGFDKIVEDLEKLIKSYM